MPAQTLFIVQQFDKVGDQMMLSRQLLFGTPAEAIVKAEWITAQCAGVVAIEQTFDTETGAVCDKPILLAAFGDLPQEFKGDA